VWLDYPRRTCVRRILARTVKDYGKQKPDLPEGCPEAFDLAVLRFAWRFPAESRPQIFTALDRHGSHLNIFRLRNDREVATFSHAHGVA
jgi:adenylate kinase family enzyme